MKPIIVKIYGGLGNQMFQYAMARTRALALNTDLLLDTRDLDKDPLRSFSLNNFILGYERAEKKYLDAIDKNLYAKVQAKFKKILPSNPYIYEEKSFNYDDAVSLDNKARFYKGYWQSYKYFEKNISDIKNQFEVKKELLINSKDSIRSIESTNSVGIHIRRGDYVANKDIFAVHGICSDSYYERAIKYLQEQFMNLSFFIFTDDPIFVASNSKFPNNSIIISGNGFSDIEEFNLMSLCKYKILANSSFSWWATFISQSSAIIAPKKWFNDPKFDTKDLIPNSWILE